MQGTSKALTVQELTRYLKMKLEGDSRLADVWVKGELSNFTRHTSGHMYFTLKDPTSRVKCVMFASQASRLRFTPENGMTVLLRGGMSVYERDGQIQLYARDMQPDGIGSLHLAFEQLKDKLEREGLFDTTRKRQLPDYPQTIGVITSPTGAAVRDIMTTLARRYPLAAVQLFPVFVQGEQAAPSIASAIEWMNKWKEVDVLIVGRGGGSIEELWAFNEEQVARAIFNSAIPVISAVGHETDVTIADFVADKRAPTPTAAAELAVPDQQEILNQLASLSRRLKLSINGKVRFQQERLRRSQMAPVLMNPGRLLEMRMERLDRTTERLSHRMNLKLSMWQAKLQDQQQNLKLVSPLRKLSQRQSQVNRYLERMQDLVKMELLRKRGTLSSSMKQLDSLSPLKVMQRGYGLAYDEQGRLLMSINQTKLNEQIQFRLIDGKLKCTVIGMEGMNDG